MLSLTIPADEFFDESQGKFVPLKEQVLKLEHSLLSVSKWESKWKKPFEKMATNPSPVETLDYIQCMTINTVDPSVYLRLTDDMVEQVRSYISDPMTATTFSSDKKKGGKRQVVTSELIYYWMVCYNIPFECEKWHLNRLITLIRVCDVKSAKPTKMKQKDVRKQNRELNAARRKALGTKG